ncbi:hypothetical protein [Pontibacter sp. G13]|uniref:hypothetical protein n=1 Tax=Pontibacter sp. G13 TaxID=3074898 RepID=UPI002889B9C2|nr:hypothetical protein [Pontibacter sp. G13]WNJ17481.1 hypothetical protein RJD25_21750 [Pontibacter sp. G13]
MNKFQWLWYAVAALTISSSAFGQQAMEPPKIAKPQSAWRMSHDQLRIVMAKAARGEAELDQGLWDLDHESRFGSALHLFEAVGTQRGVELHWETAMEYDTRYFAVERRDAKGDFLQVHLERAAGHQTGPSRYAWQDMLPADRQVSYRIRQVDRDGTQHISPIRTVTTGDRAWNTHQSFLLQDADALRKLGRAGALRIMSSDGEIHWQGSAQEATQDMLDDLEGGVYFLQLEREAHQVHQTRVHLKKQ